ncbi:hypothetical protein RRG08_010668 [Elysia crispata]|uniref:Uncharacterized protein n=1 Tax=Elysia crispata TaxID=231223 RepID=A0AAE1D8I4_9GAST|nr:hypothetical protein RRG08_010668 [Elysia crispata]
MYQPQSTSGQPTPNPGKLFHHRSTCYKIALVVLFISFAIFALGFSTSKWIIYEGEQKSWTWGLWNVDCEFDLCNTELLLTRIFFAFYCGIYLVSLGIAVHENVRTVDLTTYHSRKLELIMFLTGITGMISLAVFCFHYGTSVHVSFGWSFGATLFSLLLMFVSMMLLLCSNGKPGQRGGIVLSLNNRPMLRQPQQQVLIQQTTQSLPSPPNQMYAVQQNPYPMMNAYQAPQYPLQSQPLLPQPQPQPYPYPAVPNAPPPYSMPPAYPAQSLNPQAEFYEPTPETQPSVFSKASAPVID